MMSMKRILYVLMMLVMFTPSLACAATICATMGQNDQSRHVQEKPCHGDTQQNSDKSGLMFFKDCTNVDLGQIDDDRTVQKPDFQIDKVVYSPRAFDDPSGFSVEEPNHIRGPPFAIVSVSSYPPPYMTTLRLRI